MPKPTPQAIANITKQVVQESFEQARREVGSVTNTIMEQMGIKATGGKTTTPLPAENPMVQKMESQDRIRRVNRMTYLRQQLEQEIKRHQMTREQQIRQRQEQVVQLQQQKEEELKKQQAAQPPEIATKRKQGLFGIWGRRVKTAQQQAQPEMAGKRTSG